ncbi:signal recognition particle-docking protein FtsY [Rhodococcus sp. BP-149]|uniref:signal recognition particle-docking protein FtsY n=1 Tax=unclassified Rhodococcus (in: high G+C Gram-positive bacteria) TaxID=192944 RepID=UPI001C9A7DC8|nr:MULTISPECIES: signal recognition particle-docking protein FtsY [unclassified Rhodococcus (in: high G+C Gram-positive bacteria)]MBY6685875.1 signal recognition particle-docking protein FtsY [Rhodococcus sp. BP-288]MBY6694577.1 signal recognition particle-docking protein FtsY [Rhodococcus sp. BP-188]MBY6699439.1 signal recognition particle-docking protein FtsY [Rhodococcus sp. BP-285]MBY6703047.1 signal recognition particle-docking protein FtsY [Rhodococcus sp. BP-283]MBY6711373.1 signal reco
MVDVTTELWIVVAAVLALLVVVLVVGLVLQRRRRISLARPDTTEQVREVDRSGGYKAGTGFDFSQGTAAPPAPAPRKPIPEPTLERTDTDDQPRVGDDASVPRDAPKRGITDISLPDPVLDEPVPATEAPTVETPPVVVPPVEEETPAEPASSAPVLDEIEPTSGRLTKLRGRLSRSQNAVGRSLLGLLGGGDLDEDSWEEVEDTLLVADLGSAATAEIVATLREQMAVRNVRTEPEARALLREVLIEQLTPSFDRSIRALPHGDRPSVLLVVGVNGTGKTTTTGKLARVLVADGRRVVLGAADTFRAAAADQLQTWAERVGAEVVRGKEGADPAAVAFDAVTRGIADGVDAVLIDTAGRLHTKTGLMDELGKVKRVIEKKAPVDDVLLVLDATIGQNGLAQARVFAQVVDITGVVLTKLDGTAKGGIVFQVQRELGVPVKLVGLGEGADDLAPFEPGAFVDALLG